MGGPLKVSVISFNNVCSLQNYTAALLLVVECREWDAL